VAAPHAHAMTDWSAGRYEQSAARLLDAARIVVERAAPGPGEHVVDVGCGTGNATLLAAARGARATGVDPAQRLLAVARERAAAHGLAATFAAGDAAALPLADGAAGAVLSVFGVIFAPDAGAAAREMARVTAPGGRIVLSAWMPEGAIGAAARMLREATRRALGAPAGPPPFAWHDRDALARLLGPHGFAVALTEERLAFTDRSAGDYADGEFARHPPWIAARAVLEARGEAQAVRDRAVAILDAANEDPGAFRVTSRYVVATARRG
jgi:SAM-dependent methyltransferase